MIVIFMTVTEKTVINKRLGIGLFNDKEIIAIASFVYGKTQVIWEATPCPLGGHER